MNEGDRRTRGTLWVIAAVVIVTAAIGLWRWRSTPPEVRLPTPLERRELQLLDGLRAARGFADQLEGLPDADVRRAVRKLAVRGMARLDDDALLERAVLVDQMLQRLDEETCGALAQGQADVAQQDRALTSLARGEAEAWLDLIYRAARAELDGELPPASDPQAIQAALRFLRAKIDPQDSQRLLEVLPKLGDADPGAACWAGRLLYAEVPLLGPPHDRVLARLLAKP